MNPRVVRTRDDLLLMFRHQFEEHPGQRAQLEPIIRLVEAEPSMADGLLQKMIADQHVAWNGGYFNRLAMSTLPFVAVERVQLQLPSLLRRTRIWGNAIGDVTVEVTPEDDVYARASGTHCLISLGLVTVVHCVCLYLCALTKEMQASRDWSLAFMIARARGSFREFFDLNIDRQCADAFVEDFRGPSYRPFVESNSVLEGLGITTTGVDTCLTSGDPADTLLASVVACLCLRFLVLHELAHHHYGHNHLLEMWRDHPETAERVLKTGYPSADARRAMESFADVWATAMLITTESLSTSTVLTHELTGARIPRHTKAKCAIGAVEVVFTILASVESIYSGKNAWWEDHLSALQGKVDTIYPGAHSRAAYAVRHGVKWAISSQPFGLRWVRWWGMKRELEAIDSEPLVRALFQLWPACGLGGGLLQIKRPGYDYSPPTTIKPTSTRGEGEAWHAWDRFDYIKAHDDISDDLSRAKQWIAERTGERGPVEVA